MEHNIVKGEILVLPNGSTIENAGERAETVVTTKTDKDVQDEVYQSAMDAFENKDSAFERTLADMPCDVKEMSPLMLVLSYSMWGLDCHAIGRLLGKSGAFIAEFQETEMYVRLRKEIVEAMRYTETANVHGFLAQKATAAVSVVVTAMHQSHNGDRALSAAKDILDRAGYRPTDRVEHTHKFEDELRIVHIQDDKKEFNINVEI